MTTRPTPGAPWDDERLTAAFAARAAQAVTPVDLARATSAAIPTQASSAGTWRRLLAPAAVVILAIGAVSGGVALRGSIGVESTDGPSSEPSASPSASDPWAGRDTVGLPTISVNDAIAICDAGIDDREIAVHGWFWPVSPIPCALPPPTSLQPVCLDRYVVLMAEPESLGTGGSSGYTGDLPTGPSFQIDLDDLDSAWQPALPASRPVEIAVVGHFDDRGSTSCSPEQQDACRDRFVVDRVDSVDGETLPTSLVDYLDGTGSPFGDAKAVIDAVRPGGTVLSAAHAVGGIDPRRIDQANDDPARWTVRVLDHGALATYMVVDSTGSIYELTADGPVLVALSTPGEPASLEPSPMPQVRSTFTVEIGPDDRPVSVEVLDRTGFLENARDATSAEMDGHSNIPRPGKLEISNIRQDAILVRWTGSVCDRRPQLTVVSSVADGPPSALHLTDERPGCDAMGIGRGVVLRFSRDVKARDLVGTEEVHLVEPVPSSVLGLDVIDVEAAFKVQARQGDDREIAVAGWFARGKVPGACARPAGQQPPSHFRPPEWLLDPDCPASLDRLLSDDDTTPNLLSIRPVLGPLGYGWVGDEPTRVQVVFVGHFDDRRTTDCPPEHRTACADAFLVDAIWQDEHLIGTNWVLGADDPPAHPPSGSVGALLTHRGPWADGSSEVLSLGLVRGTRLPSLEPVINEPRLVGGTWYWHVTALDPASVRTRTFIVPDIVFAGGDDFTVWEIVGNQAVPAHLVGS